METTNLHILGGGPAGLTTGYYAKKQGLPISPFLKQASTLVETAGLSRLREQIVGFRVLQSGDFRFDTGAHRFHDKDPQVTEEVKTLLGNDLLRVEAPSEIFFKGKFYRFPLQLSDLTQKLEKKTLLKIAWEKLYNVREKHAAELR